MYPNYRPHSSTQYSLAKDDVLGIRSLYGEALSHNLFFFFAHHA